MPDKETNERAIDDQTPLYNSGILGNYIHYLNAHHSDLDTDALLRCSGLTPFDLNDEAHFLSQAQVNHFHACLDDLLSDPQISYKVGQHALVTKSAGTIRRYGLQFITPETMYKAVDRLYPKWSKGHRCNTEIVGKGRADVTVSTLPDVNEQPFQCDNRLGILESIGKLATGHPARVDHQVCMHRGGGVCRYQIFWQCSPSAAWKRVGAYATVLSTAAAGIAALTLPFSHWLLLLVSMASACMVLFLLAYRSKVDEMTGLLKEQGDAAGHLLEQIEARYHNARMVQEIGLAGADILEVDTFIHTVLASMSRNLEFSRGIVALCNDASDHLRSAGSFGFSEDERYYLDQMEFTIDPDHSPDMFIQSLKSGQPIFVNNIEKRLADMSANSIDMIENLKVSALICVPLTYKKKSLGLLLVDTKNSHKEYTTTDVNLLMGIASQLATGIVNARSYAQMQASEQRYRLLAENVTDVIWILDLDSLKMTYVSPSVEETLAYTPQELMALSIDQYLTPDAFQLAMATLGKAIDDVASGAINPENHAMTLELEEVHKNGSIVPIEVTARFLIDENDKPNGVLGISRDLSERRKAETERSTIETRLQQAQKMESLGTMAGSIAHNFNNLLMVVLGNLELAKEDSTNAETVSSSIQRAINASQRAADLSNMMLTYVGQLKKESLPVDLSHLVTTELEKLDESKMGHVTLDLDLADPMPLVAADANQMRQLISGFVTNAIEALGNNAGRVRISTGSMHCDRAYLATTYLKEEMPEGMYAYVEVADTGCGMDRETMAKVFDPFFSTKFTGRGLGMAAVMGIIRSHYGAVKVNSKEHEGSVFTALFPIQGISLKPTVEQSGPMELNQNDTTILLVDDEPMVLDIGSQFLERLGYRVKKAASGQEALEVLNTDPDHIDCLLLDYTMPGMDGLDTMQQARTIRPEAKIVISSGYTRQQLEDRFAHIVPPDGFIHKPFEMKALQATLQEVISDKH